VKSKKPSVKAKAKTSTKSKPTAKVTPKESAKPATNAFAKSLEINLKALDQDNLQSEEIEAIQESLLQTFELAKS